MSSSALTDVLPIVGVVVGGVLAWAAGSLSERSAWRRSQATRWDARRLEAYSDYASSVKQFTRACLRIAASKGLGTAKDPLDVAAGVEEIARAEDRRSAVFDTVLLLGDPSTIAAARKWNRLAWILYDEMLVGDASPTQDEFMDAFRAAGVARDEFLASARRDLRVLSDFSATVDWRLVQSPGSSSASQR